MRLPNDAPPLVFSAPDVATAARLAALRLEPAVFRTVSLERAGVAVGAAPRTTGAWPEPLWEPLV